MSNLTVFFMVAASTFMISGSILMQNKQTAMFGVYMIGTSFLFGIIAFFKIIMSENEKEQR